MRPTNTLYLLFLALVLLLTATLVVLGHGEFKDFQWAVGLTLTGIAGLVQEPPRRHPGPGSPATSLLLGLMLCGMGACDGMEMGVRIPPAAATTTEQLTLSPARTPTCPGAACLAQGPSGRVQVVHHGGDTLEIGEARSVRLQNAAPPRPAFGDLYANPISGIFYVYGLSGWDKLCLLAASAGTYTNATLTVSADGRLSIASGAAGSSADTKAWASIASPPGDTFWFDEYGSHTTIGPRGWFRAQQAATYRVRLTSGASTLPSGYTWRYDLYKASRGGALSGAGISGTFSVGQGTAEADVVLAEGDLLGVASISSSGNPAHSLLRLEIEKR